MGVTLKKSQTFQFSSFTVSTNGYLYEYMYEIQEEMKLWPDLECPLFDEEITNTEKGIARHSSVQKCG